MKRLRQLEQENGRLKKMVADRELEIDVLKEIFHPLWENRQLNVHAGEFAVRPPAAPTVDGQHEAGGRD